MAFETEKLPLIEINNLRVTFPTRSGAVEAVSDFSLHVDAGETVCVVGESGSGKSVTALSIMRLLEFGGGHIDRGQILFRPEADAVVNLRAQSQVDMCKVRGNQISMIFQEPMTSLNPVRTIGAQMVEGLMAHKGLSHAKAQARSIEMLDAVRVPEATRRLTQYPHELSGGMRQRVLIGIALSCMPKLLIADEPTTALDVSVQAEILALIRDLQKATGTAVLFITHDMGVVAEMADRVVVMRHGKLVETGDVAQIFDAPQTDYTKQLLAAVPRLGAMQGFNKPQKFILPGMPMSALRGEKESEAIAPTQPVLEVSDLVVRYPIKQGLLRRTVANVHAVEDVSFTLPAGETLGIVGESGCGKSTLGRAIMRLVDATSGTISLTGSDLTKSSGDTLRRHRRDMQMIFQDASAALDPRVVAYDQVAEPLQNFGSQNRADLRDIISELFLKVGLTTDHLDRYPHEFSGGQRQRLCIARALSLSPKLIVADESVSALDVSVQAQVLNLMLDLQSELGLSYLFISHDMAVVERVSHKVAVMYAGRIVEMGPRAAIFENPSHSYTKQLLSAVPVPDPGARSAREVVEYKPLPSPIRSAGVVAERTQYANVGEDHFVAQNF